MLSISDEADSELRSGDVRESDSASESLIFLGIVILKTNLQFNSFNELSLLFLFKDGGNTFSELGLSKSAHI